MFRRRKKTVPGLNTTSTADISFMLLIFFLVTTSMDADKGLNRLLPPPQQEELNHQRDVDEKDLLTISLYADNAITVNQQQISLPELTDIVTRFIKSRGNRHQIMIVIDRKAEYNTYFQIQNEIVRAYNILRNHSSQKRYHRNYLSLDNKERETIQKLWPQHISETTLEEGGESHE